MKMYVRLLSCYVLLILMSCSKDDSGSNMEVIKNGVSFTPTNITAKYYQEENDDEISSFIIINARMDGGVLILAMLNQGFQNPPDCGILVKSYDTNPEAANLPHTVCKITPQVAYCDHGQGDFTTKNFDIYSSIDNENKESGVINIVDNDPSKQTISGNFNFKAVNFIDSEDIITFSGNFKNIEYVK